MCKINVWCVGDVQCLWCSLHETSSPGEDNFIKRQDRRKERKLESRLRAESEWLSEWNADRILHAIYKVEHE